MVAIMAKPDTDKKRNPCNIGIDIGQVHDPTAICIAEVIQEHTGKYRYIEPIAAHIDEQGQWVLPVDAKEVLASHYYIRAIRRLPLGTSYPDVAVHIADMLCNEILAYRHVQVFLDSTGVGKPVFDDLRREIMLRKEARHVVLKPITFSYGEKYNRNTGVLGKAYLVSCLQSLLQSGRVHAPDTSEVKAMLDELRVYEIKVSESGKEQFGGKIGFHDDLATSLGLATILDPYGNRVTYSEKRIY